MGTLKRNFANNIRTDGKPLSLEPTTVTAHSPETDLQPVKSDLSALALREATNESSAAFNLPNQFIDTFATDVVGTKTDVGVQDGYVASITETTATADAGGSIVTFVDGNTRWSSTGANRDVYSGGIGYDGTSYNYNTMSSSDGQDAAHAPDSADALLTGNFRISFHGNGMHDAGSSNGTTSNDYYEFGIAYGTIAVENNAILGYGSHSGLSMAWLAFGGPQRDLRIGKTVNGNTKTLLDTKNGGQAEGWQNSTDVISFARMDGRLYLQVNDVTKYTYGTSDYNDTSANWAIFAWGRGGTSGSARYYMDAKYRSGMSAVKGITTGTASATGTAIQAANVVGSAKTKVGGTLLYKDNAGTNTLGTDLKVYMTCDGGSNWTEAASYNAVTPVYSTGVKQVRLGETTCTSGTDIRYKIEWANQAAGSKEAQVHGIGINY